MAKRSPPDFEIAPGRFITADGDPCFIIAEIGQNHQGDMDIAKKLIRVAKDAGADCVKFQKSNLASKFTRSALDRPYGGPNSWGATYGEHKAHLEFSMEQYRHLQLYASEIGILFTASAMDPDSVDDLHSLDVPFIKIGSGDNTNDYLLRRAAGTRRPLVVSTDPSSAKHTFPLKSGSILGRTSFPSPQRKYILGRPRMDLRYGEEKDVQRRMDPDFRVKSGVRPRIDVEYGMMSFEDVVSTYNTLRKAGAKFCLLHCVSAYPTPPQHQQLRALPALAAAFPDTHIGYSGHELGIYASIAAVALGARVLERHITLDHKLRGSDHACSLEPRELAELVRGVRVVEAAMSSPPTKSVQTSEAECWKKLGKSLVAARPLRRGQSVGKDDIVVKVADPPGLAARRLLEVTGREALNDIQEDEAIQPAFFGLSPNSPYGKDCGPC